MLIMGILGVTAPQSMAADLNCTGVVNDGAGVLSSSDITDIENAANKLRSKGAEVHVVTSSNGMFVDDYQRQVLSSICPNWGDGPNGIKESVVLFMMAFDPNDLVFSWGAQFDKYYASGDYTQDVIQGAMSDQAHAGNYGQSFVDGINMAYEGATAGPSSGTSGNTPSPTITTNGSTVAVFGIVFGVLFVLVLVGIGIWLLLRRQQANEARKKMRQRALSARDAATQINNDLGSKTAKDTRNSRIKKYKDASDTLASDLKRLAAVVDTCITDSRQTITSAAVAGEGADDPNLTAGEYEELAQRYEAALENSEQAERAADEFDDLCQQADSQLAQATQTTADIETRLGNIQETITGLEKEGIKVTDIQKLIDASLKALDAAKPHLNDLSVLRDLAKSEEQLEAAEAAVQTMATQRADLLVGLPALKSRIAVVTGQLDSAKDCFDRISSTYATSSWDSVKGNGTEARKRIADAHEAFDDATADASLDKQRWDKATEAMQEGNQLLDEAVSYLRSIHALETSLADAKAEAPREIEDAAEDIAKAERYLTEFERDVDKSLRRSLEEAQQTLAQAQHELEQVKPDYLMVVRLALSANHSADDILADAVEDHEAMERKRRLADSGRKAATRAISEADEYFDDHDSKIDQDAKDLLKQARSHMANVNATSDFDGIIDAAGKAAKKAEEALGKAKRDVRDAESSRYSSSSTSSYTYGGGSYRHNSSSPWGSGGGGHTGGSISFGGGGGGHTGGSTGF